MRHVDLLIFDLDGTLIDSKDDITSCVNATLRQFNLTPLEDGVIARYIGIGVRPLLAELAKGPPAASLPEILEDFELRYERHLTDRTRTFPGAIEILTHYSSKKCVVLTNKRQRFADKIVADLNLRTSLAGVYGREAFARSKPDPLPIIEICRIHKADPRRAVMIGDTEIDMMAGTQAMVATCAALYGYGEQSSLLATGPDFTISRLTDLTAIFR